MRTRTQFNSILNRITRICQQSDHVVNYSKQDGEYFIDILSPTGGLILSAQSINKGKELRFEWKRGIMDSDERSPGVYRLVSIALASTGKTGVYMEDDGTYYRLNRLPGKNTYVLAGPFPLFGSSKHDPETVIRHVQDQGFVFLKTNTYGNMLFLGGQQ